jgi:hypothetical protein
MTIVIAGDVEGTAVLDGIQRWPAVLLQATEAGKARPLPSAAAPAPRPVRPPLPPAPAQRAIERVTGPVQNRRLVLLWPMPPEPVGGDAYLLAALVELGAVFEAHRGWLPARWAFFGSLRPAGALAVVSTSLPPSELAPMMETFLGKWTDGTAVTTHALAAAGPPRAGRSVRVLQADAAKQVDLRIGCGLPALGEATLPAQDLLRALVDRGVGEIRASWGASYGFEVKAENRPGGIAHLEISGLVDPARAVDAVARVLALLARLASDGPDLKSFTLERWDVGREFNQRLAGVDGRTNALLFAADQRLSQVMWDDYPKNLADLSRASIRPLLGACAGRESVVLLGDKAALEGQLKARGIGSPPDIRVP